MLTVVLVFFWMPLLIFIGVCLALVTVIVAAFWICVFINWLYNQIYYR